MIGRAWPATRLLGAVAITGGAVLTSAPADAQTFEPFTRAPDVEFPAAMAADATDDFVIVEEMAALRTTGDVSVLVIPALFSDSPEPAVTVDQLTTILFATAGRTLTTFYDEMSAGRLNVSGHVTDWVRTPYTVLDAAGSVDGHGWVGEYRHEHFRAALSAVDSVVDFTQFDSDGPDGIPDSGDDDGYVDAVTFKFTEVAGSCGGPGFWPHRGGLQDSTGAWGVATTDTAASGEPIRVLDYTTESVVECDGETPQGPSVMAHEFGHILGLPDFYRAVEGIESTQRYWMVGCFGLMAAGSWGCGTAVRVQGYGPSGLSPLSRQILGWDQRIDVGPVDDTVFTLRPVQTTGEFLRVPLTESWDEYLLIEYRPRLGFDDALPASGVLVYHVDATANIMGGAYASTFPYWLLEADGNLGLKRTLLDGGDRGTAADVFARDGAVDSITPATAPSTRLANGEGSSVWIRSITVDGDSARVRLSTVTALSGTLVSAPDTGYALEPFEVRYQIHGGVAPYEAVAPGATFFGDVTASMSGDTVTVRVVPLIARYRLHIPVHVRDSDGDAWWLGHLVQLEDAAFDDDELLLPLVSPSANDADLRDYLDRSGNRNEGYDVGDLRAYVLRTGG